MITNEMLSNALVQINSLPPQENKNLIEFPNPFEYSMTEMDLIIYKSIRETIVEENYSNASIILDQIYSPYLRLFILNKLLLDFCQCGNLGAFNFVVNSGAQVNLENNRPLITICKSGNLSLLLSLIDFGININSNPEALYQAALNGQKEVITELIKVEVNINANNSMALRLCAQQGLSDMVDFLIQNGADVNALDDNALMMAVVGAHVDTVRILLHHGAKPSGKNGRIFLEAKKKGLTEILDLLMCKQSEIDLHEKYMIED